MIASLSDTKDANQASETLYSPHKGHFALFGMTIHHHSTKMTFPNETAGHLLWKLREICEIQNRGSVEADAEPTGEHAGSPDKQQQRAGDDIRIDMPDAKSTLLNESLRCKIQAFLDQYEHEYLVELEALWDDYPNISQQHRVRVSAVPSTFQYPRALTNSYSTHIIPSLLEYRSLFTWLIHKISQMKRLKKDARQRMEHVIELFVEYAAKMMQERLDKLKKSPTGRMSLMLFSEDIDFEADHRIHGLHINDFLENIGDEYRYTFAWFYNVMVSMTAAFYRCDAKVSSLPSKVMLGTYYAYYFLRPKLAAQEMVRFFKTVTVEQGRTLWNLQDDPLFRVALFSIFPHVDYSSVFSIPSFTYEDLLQRPVKKRYLETHVYDDSDEKNSIRTLETSKEHASNKQPKTEPDADSPIVVESVNLLEDSSLQTTPPPDDNSPRTNNPLDATPISTDEIEIIELQHVHNKKDAQPLNQKHTFDPISPLGGVSLEEFHHYRKQLHVPLRSYSRENIEIRLLYHGKNTHLKEYNFGRTRRDYPLLSSLLSTVYMFTDKAPESDPDVDSGNIIIQIHGGGFLAMSTFAHENYLRELCRQTGMPIFSIEYTTAPDERYPAQIEQCFHAYQWIIQNAQYYMGVPLKKVFLTGDSAGGNLSCATTIRCIEEEFRAPDGLILTYPATNVSSTPSQARMLSLLDPLVNISFMKLCSTYYPHSAANLKRDPFISPVFVSDKILAQFPPCFISVGTLDPLYDDTVMLAERLSMLIGHENLCLHIWDGLGHGYMNTIDFVGEATLVIRDYSRWIQGLIRRDSEQRKCTNTDECYIAIDGAVAG